LVRLRRLAVVLQQPDLARDPRVHALTRRVHETLEPLDALVRRVPRNAPGLARRREVEEAHDPVQAEALVDEMIPDLAVVVDAEAAVQDRAAVAEQVVREAETRLERAQVDRPVLAAVG